MSDNTTRAVAPIANAGLYAMSQLMKECIDFADRLFAMTDAYGNVHVTVAEADHRDDEPHVRMAW